VQALHTICPFQHALSRFYIIHYAMFSMKQQNRELGLSVTLLLRPVGG